HRLSDVHRQCSSLVSLHKSKIPSKSRSLEDTQVQGRTDNSWGPRAIGDHGAPVSSPKTQKSL
ncbi:unnamed protein product, partial [Staurois parvus]